MSRSKAKRRSRIAALLCALALLALGVTFAQAEITRKGNLQVNVTGKLAPRTLPRTGLAPVAVSVAGKITTTNESSPPQLHKLTIEINRHGRIDAKGLPTCRLSRIRTASNGHALAACGSSLVGEGKFFGTITLPGSTPYQIEGKLLVFNGTEGGHQVLYGHVFSPHPFATSFVITFALSSKRHGTYGTVLTANLSKALGTQRNLTGLEMTLKRSFSYRGKRHSYISAGCPAAKGIPIVSFPLARTSFAFAGGTKITETLSQRMQAARLRAAATLLLAASLAALLCACGGGGGSQATTAPSAPSTAQTHRQGPLPGHPKIAAKPAPGPGGSQAQGSRHGSFTRAGAAAAERRAARRARAAHRRLARKAGKAAPFLVPVGDNSIPTYGSQASASQQSEAEAGLSSYLSARQSGDWSAACSQMAATVQKQLAALAGTPEESAKGCPAAYAKLSSRVPAASRASVLIGSLTALRVEGDKAFALFYGPREQQYMMPMVSEGGAWKVNQIEPISWPLGAPKSAP